MYLKEVVFTIRGEGRRLFINDDVTGRRVDCSSSTLSTAQKRQDGLTDWQSQNKVRSYCQCGYVSLSTILIDLFLSVNNEIIEFLQ